MLLAEALCEREDALRRLDDLEQRTGANARAYRDTRPAEDPQKLLRQATEVIERICALDLAVEATNGATTLPAGGTLSEALTRRAMLDRRLRLLEEVATRAADVGSSFGRDAAMLDIAAVRAEADHIRALHRALDVEIQCIDWTTELIVAV